MSQNVAQTSPEFRLHLVNSILATNSDGPCLSDLSVAGVPEGALAFVIGLNAFYRYKPRSVATPDTTTGYRNVVKAAGPGNWVRQIQMASVALTGGTATITSKFDLSGSGDFVVSGASNAGTVGERVAVKTSVTVATVNSSSGSDTSVVLVQYIEQFPA